MSSFKKIAARAKGSCSRISLCVAGLLPLMGLVSTAHAQTLEDALRQTTVSGLVGVDDFTYPNNVHTPYTTNAFAVGGDLIVHTGAFDGFSIGLGGYTGQSLGLYSRNPEHDDSPELTSNTHSEQSIREAYLQYMNSWLEVRGGRQMINTPYANQDWYTFNPRAFMGFAGIINVIGDNTNYADSAPLSLTTSTATLSVFAARIFGYNERYSSSFTTGNRYLDNSNGFITLGTRYQKTFGATNISLQAWYYDFYALAQDVYGQADFTTQLGSNRTVFGALQISAEGNSGSGHSYYGSVDGHIYGGKIGMGFGEDNIALIGDFSPQSYGSFRHGGFIHPYNDNSGTIFTDTMQNGIEDLGPGYAVGVTGNIVLLNDKLKISPSYVEYQADYGFGGNTFTYDGAYGFPTGTPVHNQHIHVIDSNFNYDLSSLLKGLSFDWDTDAAFADNGDQGQHFNNPYFNSRLFLKYVF